MSTGIYGAFRLFAGVTPDPYQMALNRTWAKRGQMAGLVAGACSFVLRDWRVQFISLACFVAATVLDDVHKVNSWTEVDSADAPQQKSPTWEDPAIRYLKGAAAKADTIFLRYFTDSVWARVKTQGLIRN
jgi:hypothetical protein